MYFHGIPPTSHFNLNTYVHYFWSICICLSIYLEINKIIFITIIFLKAKDKVTQRNQYCRICTQNKWLTESFVRFTVFSKTYGCLYLMWLGNNEAAEEYELKFSLYLLGLQEHHITFPCLWFTCEIRHCKMPLTVSSIIIWVWWKSES